LELVSCAAKTGKPLILSTGMSNIAEIYQSVSVAHSAVSSQLILMKCVSGYPASPKQMNLKTIPHMQQLFECPVGLSDHSIGTAVSVSSVALGANCIEKHFTLDTEIKTPDSFFSITISDLKRLVEDIRTAEEALGKVSYKPAESEKNSWIFRRSLFVVEDIRKGEKFTDKNIRPIRPSGGLKPALKTHIIGRIADKNIKKGTPLTWELIK
jgi:N-acetylneuraminate synthase